MAYLLHMQVIMITTGTIGTSRAQAQKTGRDMDVRKIIHFENYGDALQLYRQVCERLLDINGWNELNGIKKKQYQLCNNLGLPKTGFAQEGDYIRFDLPAPRGTVSSVYDWVRIERIRNVKTTEDKYAFGMRVRPAADPTRNENSTAHFYTAETTNTFTAEVSEHTLIVGIHPRNEIINTAEAEDFYSQVRNLVVGFMSWLGIARSQWATLINGLVSQEY